MLFFQAITLTAEQIPVRHIEGVTLGFLVLRNPRGEALAYQPGVQVADFLQVGRRSRLRDLTKHLATDAEIRLLQKRF